MVITANGEADRPSSHACADSGDWQTGPMGEDPHDLQIQRLGDADQFSIPELPPGEVGEASLRLHRDSRYVMWCSLEDHRQLGMEASVRVRRKKR